MVDKPPPEREFANEQLARAHDAEKMLRTVHELLVEALASHKESNGVKDAWAWNRIHTAVSLLEQTRAVGDPRLWALIDELFEAFAFIDPQDILSRKTKVYDILVRAGKLP